METVTSVEPLTDVIFRQWHAREGADVVALFPGLVGTNDPATCQSYQHVGQHASADPAGVVRASRPATPEQYAPLLAELQRIGYRLRVVRRQSPRHLRQRRAVLASH